MSRYAVNYTKASGAAAAWHSGLRCPSTADCRLWELHVFAETAVAGAVELRRITTAGVGAATSVTPITEDPQVGAATVVADTAFATTVPASTALALRRYSIAGSIGQGIIWTWPNGLIVPVSGALGIFQTSALAVTYGITWVFDQ